MKKLLRALSLSKSYRRVLYFLTFSTMVGIVFQNCSPVSFSPVAGKSVLSSKDLTKGGISLNSMGQCGSSNGQVMSAAPTSGLCQSGVASDVIGSGPWTWSCTEKNSAIVTSCQTYSSNTTACYNKPALTNYVPCAIGQSGQITMVSNYNCPSGKEPGAYSPFIQSGNTCATPVSMPIPEVKIPVTVNPIMPMPIMPLPVIVNPMMPVKPPVVKNPAVANPIMSALFVPMPVVPMPVIAAPARPSPIVANPVAASPVVVDNAMSAGGGGGEVALISVQISMVFDKLSFNTGEPITGHVRLETNTSFIGDVLFTGSVGQPQPFTIAYPKVKFWAGNASTLTFSEINGGSQPSISTPGDFSWTASVTVNGKSYSTTRVVHIGTNSPPPLSYTTSVVMEPGPYRANSTINGQICINSNRAFIGNATGAATGPSCNGAAPIYLPIAYYGVNVPAGGSCYPLATIIGTSPTPPCEGRYDLAVTLTAPGEGSVTVTWDFYVGP